MSDSANAELTVPTGAGPPSVPETQAPQGVQEKSTVDKADARTALEALAKPSPKPEAPIESPELIDPLSPLMEPKTEQINQTLTNASQAFLNAGDRRVLLSALARQAGPTPLGNELRRDTLEMIRNSDLPGFENLKKEIADMNLPKTDPAQSQLVSFLERHNKTHPGGEVPAELIDAVKTGKMESAPLVARALQENSALSEQLWTELIGKDKPRPQLTTPDGLLGAAGLEKNDANRARVEAMFKPLRVKKEVNINLGDMVPSILGGMMLLSFVTQLAMTDSGQSQGH